MTSFMAASCGEGGREKVRRGGALRNHSANRRVKLRAATDTSTEWTQMRRIVPLLLLVPTLAAAQAPATPIHIPLEPYGSGWLRTVQVVMAGDTLDFLFDTGGGVTVISPELARRTGCEPSGRMHGYRMTGQHLETPVCRDVALAVGGFATTTEASVFDLMSVLGPDAPRVDGMISLRTFAGRTLTLDLPGGRLTVETAESLPARVRGMTPVDVRLATGLEGGALTAYVGVPVGVAVWWLGWDSGHQGTTFVAPWVAAALAMDSTEPSADRRLALAPGLEVLMPVERKEIIHDGMLSAAAIARAVWTVDLAAERMWVGPMAPLLELPRAGAEGKVAAPARAPEGWYEVTLVVNGSRQRSLMRVERTAAGLSARLRFVGSDTEFALRDVRAEQGVLTFGLPMRQVYPVRLAFRGLTATGTWGDPAGRGGAAEAVKVR
jgi:hypothetical protein